MKPRRFGYWMIIAYKQWRVLFGDLNEWMNTSCVFRPANKCSARRSLVKINCFVFKCRNKWFRPVNGVWSTSSLVKIHNKQYNLYGSLLNLQVGNEFVEAVPCSLKRKCLDKVGPLFGLWCSDSSVVFKKNFTSSFSSSFLPFWIIN